MTKARHERHSAAQIQAKLEQTLPIYQRSAEAYSKLAFSVQLRQLKNSAT